MRLNRGLQLFNCFAFYQTWKRFTLWASSLYGTKIINQIWIKLLTFEGLHIYEVKINWCQVTKACYVILWKKITQSHSSYLKVKVIRYKLKAYVVNGWDILSNGCNICHIQMSLYPFCEGTSDSCSSCIKFHEKWNFLNRNSITSQNR